jgi:DNA primase
VKGVTSEVIAEVRSRANLLEVISEVVVLKRAGKEYRGLCPFHAEKTPSFHVNPEKGIYKCFGCGEGGDVFAFLQKHKGLDFIDSVRELAHKYGIRLVETSEDRQEYDRRSHMLLLYEQAAEYFAHLLQDPREGAIAQQYLNARGVTTEIIERFRLGYAPHSWDGLLRYLTDNKKVAAQTLEEAGLVRRRPDSTSYYDLFRNRLMIPICDDQGRVIAFGGRTLGDDQVKYLNSPESPIYTKGQHLFALHLAKDSIKNNDAVIVVEGYFDAITAHEHGFDNTVATLGTALTDRQAKLLVRYTDSRRVYLSFDTDTAGERAVDRGVEMLNQIAEGIGLDLRVIRVPGGKDPDECLRSDGGREAFENAVKIAPALVDYQLEKAISAVDTRAHTGRIDAARNIVPILALIKNSVGRGEYVRQWALRLGIREEELLSDVGQYRRQKGMGLAPQTRPSRASSARHALQPGYIDAERRLLALYLTSREDHSRVYEAMLDEQLVVPVHQNIKTAIEGIGTQFGTIEDLAHRLRDRLAVDADATKTLFEIIWKVDEIRKQNAPVEVILKEVRARILQERVNQELTRLRLLQGTSGTDEEQGEILFKMDRLKRLELQLRGLKSEEELVDVKRKIEEALLGSSGACSAPSGPGSVATEVKMETTA